MHKYLPFFCMLAFLACKEPEKENKTWHMVEDVLIDSQNVRVVSRYIQFSESADSSLRAWNKTLRQRTEPTRELQTDLLDPAIYEKGLLIESEGQVLFENDSLMALEYRLIRKSGNNESISYYPLIILKKEGTIAITPEQLWPDFDRRKLRGIYKQKTDEFNETAYELGVHTILPFCFSQDSLIVYPGTEGEFFGRNRISVPFADLGISLSAE